MIDKRKEKETMPNWCNTQIIFHGNKNEIEDFHNKIREWTKDYRVTWLSSILYGVGLADRIDSESNSIRCRGYIDYIDDVYIYSDSDAKFYIDTETAWSPMLKMWSETIAKLNYKTINFSYQAEEPGCQLYQIYDPYGDFKDRYYVDCFLAGEDVKNEKLVQLSWDPYYSSDEVLRTSLMTLLDTEGSLDELIEKAEHYPFKDDESYIQINKYEILDADSAVFI